MVDYRNTANYRKAYPKQYSVYATVAKKGTVVINKLEQPELHKKFGRDWFSADEVAKRPELQQLVANGLAYMVSDKEPIVLSGTRGELWLGRPDSLAKKYAVGSGDALRPLALPNGAKYEFNGTDWVFNGQPYFKVEKRFDDMRREWVKLTTYGTQNNFVYACFIPKNQVVSVMAYGTTKVTANADDVLHGRGDFICCYPGPDGRPSFNDVWVVNGLVFRDTYNNAQWKDCLVGPTVQLYQMSMDKLPAISVGASAKQWILDEIAKYYRQASTNVHPQSRWTFMQDKDTGALNTQANLIKNMIKTWSTPENQVNSLVTTLKLEEEDALVLRAWAQGNNKKDRKFKLELGKGGDGLEKAVKLIDVLLSLTGYIPADCNKISKINPNDVGKECFDGIHTYTVNSSPLNRILRGQKSWKMYGKDSNGKEIWRQDSDDDYRGQSYADYKRAIDGCDRFFEHAKISSDKGYITVFRGDPYNGRGFTIANRSGKDPSSTGELAGWVATNTAYTSTSLNALSTLLFAAPPGAGTTVGIIYALRIPAGAAAYYVHDIAGWEEQFEVLLHRKYDIKIGRTLLKISGANGVEFEVRDAELVEHKPLGELSQANHADLIARGYKNYDKDGLIPLSSAHNRNVLQKAFQLLKEKGLGGITYTRTKQKDYIVVNSSTKEPNKETGMYENIAFRVEVAEDGSDNYSLMVYKLSSRTKDSLVRYWQDANRNGGNIDHNFSWGFNRSSGDVVVQLMDSMSISAQSTADASKKTAQLIQKYVIITKNCLAAPLQEIGRYFDMVFKSTTQMLGFMIYESAPVERKVSEKEESDPDAGEIRLRYVLSGDNDNNVVLKIKMHRGENESSSNSARSLGFRAMAAGNGNRFDLEISDKKIINYTNQRSQIGRDINDGLEMTICNREIMEALVTYILEKLSGSLKLSHDRRFKSVLAFTSKKISGVYINSFRNLRTDIEKNVKHGNEIDAAALKSKTNVAGDTGLCTSFSMVINANAYQKLTGAYGGGEDAKLGIMMNVVEGDGNYNYSCMIYDSEEIPEEKAEQMMSGIAARATYFTLKAKDSILVSYEQFKEALFEFLTEKYHK